MEGESQAAELLAVGELYDVVVKKAALVRAGATRIQESFTAFEALSAAVPGGRITLARALVYALIFLVGVVTGYALGAATW